MSVTSDDTESAVPRVLGVIPARLASTRLPRKVLRELAGRPLLAWVYEAAIACPQLDQVVVAVDSEEVAAVCAAYGWPWRMTSPHLPSGTDRLFAVAREMDAEIYVNVQGDEPLLQREHIEQLLEPFRRPEVDVTTLKVRCTPGEIADPNAVKVVTAGDGRALYFSRAPIPFNRDGLQEVVYWKHIGLYAYRKATLQRFASLAPGTLEGIERLEQLRLLENGLAIHVSPVEQGTIGVDTEDDLLRVESVLRVREADRAVSQAQT